jgi:uncharacterized membrane-anchored protein
MAPLRPARFVIPILLTLCLLAAAPAPKRTSDPRLVAMLALHWSHGPQHLRASNSTLTPPRILMMVSGSDAAKFYKLSNGEDDAAIEAIGMNFVTGDPVYVEYHDAGYVTSGDWTDVDATAMLENIKNNTEAQNAEKKTLGIKPLHVLHWVRKPVYDKATQTVHWAIAAQAEGEKEPLVNSVALKLSRNGYEELTWVVDEDKYVDKGGMLDRALRGLEFNKGARYEDYLPGDKLAGYGIAALVGTAAGATLVKTGALTALLLLLKKFWLLAIAGIAWGWWALSGRRKAAPPTTPATPAA